MRWVLIVLGIATASPAFAEAPTMEQYRTLQSRVDALETMVNDLTTSTVRPAVARETTTMEPPVQIVDWSETTWYDSTQPFYRITYTITNNSAKAIKLIQASIGFQDNHGAELFRIPIDHSLVVAPGEATLITRDYLVSRPAAPKDAPPDRVPKLVKSDIVGKLMVRSVVYSDNTIVNYGR